MGRSSAVGAMDTLEQQHKGRNGVRRPRDLPQVFDALVLRQPVDRPGRQKTEKKCSRLPERIVAAVRELFEQDPYDRRAAGAHGGVKGVID
ncbi:hypothetical protein ACIOJE_38385 [Kitasatospora sp. NPDC087861]|uniref:hypothetical protein n=1 Tax=Kitasatospora sp. NPDC087861 TaxID=3364070 RepID=UPI00382C757B